jgi:hypothetical protein
LELLSLSGLLTVLPCRAGVSLYNQQSQLVRVQGDLQQTTADANAQNKARTEAEGVSATFVRFCCLLPCACCWRYRFVHARSVLSFTRRTSHPPLSLPRVWWQAIIEHTNSLDSLEFVSAGA